MWAEVRIWEWVPLRKTGIGTDMGRGTDIRKGTATDTETNTGYANRVRKMGIGTDFGHRYEYEKWVEAQIWARVRVRVRKMGIGTDLDTGTKNGYMHRCRQVCGYGKGYRHGYGNKYG